MRKFPVDILIALIIGVVGNALYSIVTQTLSAAQVFIIFFLLATIYAASRMLYTYLVMPRDTLKRGGILNVYDDYSKAKERILSTALKSQSIKLTTIGGGTIFEVDWGQFLDLLESGARKGVSVKILALA
jgi:hypothetical protein